MSEVTKEEENASIRWSERQKVPKNLYPIEDYL